MFGAYQAGVWQALAPVFRPDMVIGCSVGSINGWSIAAGISGEDLVRTWLDPRCAQLMRRRSPRRPWQAFFDPAPLGQMVQELVSTYTPQVPFAVAVTELPRLRLRLFETPNIREQHLMASCAIPVGFPTVRIDGRRYCDGGLLSVLPLWAARRLGAGRVIAVNVLPKMPLTTLRAVVRVVRWLAPKAPPTEGLEVLMLEPDSPLGRLHDAITWQPDVIRGWVARGQADARKLMDSPKFAAMLGRFV
jgi:NTE family protein